MFTQTERERLQCFCDICEKAANCRFLRDFNEQPHHILVGKLPGGRVMDEYPRYDDDDFRAFVTHYRKLRSEGETTNLVAIINLLQTNADANDKAMFKHFKNEIREEGRGWWGATGHDKDGNKEFLTQEEMEKLILYGDVLHADVEKKSRLARVVGRNGLMKTLALCNYIRFARTVVHIAQETAAAIRNRGYLNSSFRAASE
jgi:hypothetical protein